MKFSKVIAPVSFLFIITVELTFSEFLPVAVASLAVDKS